MRDPGLRVDRAAEIQVGALVLVSVLVLVAGVLWITGAEIGRERLRLHAVTPDAAQVASGSRVYLRGVDVGSVERVELAEDRAVLRLEVDETSLPRDTRAEVRPSGFLGSQMVRLVPGSSERLLADGDTIAAGTAPDLQSIASQLGSDVTAVLERTRTLLSGETVDDVRGSARSVSAAMRELRSLVEAERRTISSLLDALERTARRLSEATSGPELERSVARVDSLTRRLDAIGGELEGSSRSLTSILAKVDGGEGSLGRLVNDPRLYDRFAAAAENVQTASEELALLARDVRSRPGRYLGELDLSLF